MKPNSLMLKEKICFYYTRMTCGGKNARAARRGIAHEMRRMR